MASTNRLCIGTSNTTGGSGNQVSVIHVNNSAQPWYPSTSAEANSTTGRQIRTMEIFWFVSGVTTSPANRVVFQAKNTSNSVIARLFCSAYTSPNATMSMTVADRLGTARTVNTTGIPLLSNVNVWWHSVIFRASAAQNADWKAYHGRVGLAVNGSPSTADSWPYPYVGTTALNLAGSDDRMLGFRSSSTGTDVCHITMGGSIGTFAGTSISSTSRWIGGFAEMRVWSDNRGLIAKETGGSLFDLRDQFIDGTQYPTLVHCLRFNESGAVAATDFDNVGTKKAFFVTSFLNSGFDSSPIPDAASITEQRTGAYKVQVVPSPVERIGTYKVRQILTPERTGSYKVRRETTPTRDGTYAVSAQVTASRDGAYKVNSEAQLLRNGSYVVQIAEVADQIQRMGEYRVRTEPTISRTGEYVIGLIPTISRTGEYRVLRGIGELNRTGTYKIATFPSPVTKTGAYKVAVSYTANRTGEYRIAGQSDAATIQRRGSYVVYNADFTAALLMRKHAELRSRTR